MIQIIIIIFLTLVNGVFAMSEVALISVNENKIKVKAEQGDKKSIALSNLISDSNKFLSTIQIGITLAGYLSSAFASDAFAGQLAAWFHGLMPTISIGVLTPIAMVVVTLILSYFSIVLGEMVPKRLGMRDPEKFSYAISVFISTISVMTRPFVQFLSFSTNLVVRLLGIDPFEDDSKVTEEEIRMMTDVAQEKGAIRENEKNMINNIFNFDNTPVSDIMTHRTEVEAVEINSTYEEVLDIVFGGRFSRYPVYEDSIDNIIGIIHLRELLHFHQTKKAEDFKLNEIMRKPYYVPDSIFADELFFDLQTKNIHIAVVVDEHGGTAGVVSVEDLLEEIVGDIFDEYDEKEDDEILEIARDSYIVDGDVPLDRIEEMIYCDLPLSDYDTISGFMIGLLGRLPTVNDHQIFEYNGYLFEILEADNRVVLKAGIQKLSEESESIE